MVRDVTLSRLSRYRDIFLITAIKLRYLEKSRNNRNIFWNRVQIAIFVILKSAIPSTANKYNQARSQLFAKGGALCRATLGRMTFYNWKEHRGAKIYL